MILLVIFGTLEIGRRLNVFEPFFKKSDQENKPNQFKKPEAHLLPKSQPKNQPFENIVFPNNFFFGTAYSDFQTTGISQTSDWYEYINNLEPPQIGPGIGNDLFNRYKEDFNLAGQVGVQVHRISLEWSRFEPEEKKWDMKMVEKYKYIFNYMKKHGIEPMICLNHFPLPKWFADQGGWENPKAPELYERYAGFIAKNIGVPLKIKWWLTFNEPQFVISIPYSKGGWPPFKKINDLKDVLGTQRLFLVTSHVMDGHRLAYRSIHQAMGKSTKIKPMVGFASAAGSFYPNDPNSPLDQLAFNIFNSIHTLLFDYVIGNTDRDFIGLNYYGRNKLKMHLSVWKNMLPWLTENKPMAIEWDPEKRAQNGRPKEFYPQALYEMMMKFKDLRLPIIITENGLDDDADKFREEFIVIHLKAIHDAIRDGANVIGYQYWALADTWEPGDNSFSQMGLIKIDRKNNLARSLRPSAWTYAEIIKTKTIKKELLEKHKEFLTK